MTAPVSAPAPEGSARAPGGWRDARFGATAAALALAAPVAVFAYKGLVFVFALAALPHLRRSAAAALWRRCRPVALASGLLCAWACATLAYAPDPDILRALRNFLLIVAGPLWVASLGELPEARRRVLARFVVAALWAAIALFVVQLATDGAATRWWYADHPFIGGTTVDEKMAPGKVLVAALVWPAAGWLWRRGRRRAAIASIAAAAAVVPVLRMDAGTVGLFLGGAAFFAALRWPRGALAAVVGAFAAYAVAAPAVSTHWLTVETAREAWPDMPDSWVHRVGTWTRIGGEIEAAGPFGAGYDASRVIGDRAGKMDIGGRERRTLIVPVMSMHPHNGALQIRLELGIPGLAALVFLGIGIGAAVRRAAAEGTRAAGLTAAFAAMLAPFFVSYDLWSSWWLAAFMLVAAGAALLTPPEDRAPA